MANSSSGVGVHFCLVVVATLSGGCTSRAEATTVNTTQLASTRGAAYQRLASQTCDEFERSQRAQIDAEILEMRQDVAQSLDDWRNEQVQCWQQYRRNAEYWRSMKYGSNSEGLGLSGIGEGGGGRGEGIGLGSIGAVGHGQGFGAGHGRLGGGQKKAYVSGARVSTTNVQVQGVDEADIVKTDGKHVYFAINDALRIAAVNPPRIVSVTPLRGKVKELFLQENRVVVYVAFGGMGKARCAYGYDCEMRGDGSRTQLIVLDVSRPAAPVVRRRFELSGSLIAARRIEDTVHTVVVDGERTAASVRTWPDSLPRCGVRESAVKAQLDRLAAANERAIRTAHALPTLTENGSSRRFCESILRDSREPRPAFTTVYSFNLRDDKTQVTGTSIQSRPGTVYAGSNALYVAVRVMSPYGNGPRETTDLHKFQLGARATDTKYLASGTVKGRVLNQFAMDEWRGNLRVATTSGRLPSPNVESRVAVLAERSGRLLELGAVEHLAPGEDIRSVRFDAERAYVVTFKKTDPLFVLDFSEPAAPRLLGELKIPGFSTYLHRLDRDHLLSIGFDTDDRGGFAYFKGLLLQLFDVSRPTEPQLMHRETIGTRGSSSEAATNHLAFNFLAEDGLLAIPSTVCEGGGGGRAGHSLTFAGLLVYRVSLDEGFHLLGGIDHSRVGSRCNAFWSQSTSTVKRSLFLDDQVWSIAMDQAKVQKISALGTDLASLRLN